MSRHIQAFLKPISFQETYLAVEIFFLLSGIVICQAYEEKLLVSKITAWRFFLFRVIRIWPLYFLGTVISLVAIMIRPTEPFYHSLIYLSLGALFLPNPFFTDRLFPLNPPAWSLFLELVANVFYGFFVRLLGTKVLLSVIAICAVQLLTISVFSNAHHYDIGFSLAFLPISFARVGYSFFLGVLLYRVFASKQRKGITGARANLLAGFILCLIAAILLVFEPTGLWRGGFDFISVTLVFPCLIYISLFCNVTSTFKTIAHFLGVTSYAVYVIHVPVGEIFQSLDHRLELWLIEAYAPWSGFVFSIVVVALAYALDRYFDRPVRRFAAKFLGFQRVRDVSTSDEAQFTAAKST